MLTAIIVVGGAIAVGLLANQLFRDRVGGDDKGSTARGLLGPLLTRSARSRRSIASAADARRGRVSAAAGTVPAVVFAFMLALVGIALALLAFFLPRKHRGAQIATLALVGLVLIGALARIHSLDQPFKGVLKIEPVEMAESSEQMTAEYRTAYGPGVPCDRRGVALTVRRS